MAGAGEENVMSAAARHHFHTHIILFFPSTVPQRTLAEGGEGQE
jgi:hypothetical protein